MSHDNDTARKQCIIANFKIVIAILAAILIFWTS